MANTTNFAVEKPTVGGYRNSWGGTLNTGFDKLTELLALAMPIGTIQMYPKATAPVATTNGGTWLVCDGTSLVRADYPELHTLITNTYGTYPSGTTFLLPDMRTRVPLGYSASTLGSGDAQRTPKAIAAVGGEESHTLTEAELRGHTHVIANITHTHAFTSGNSATGIADTNLAKSNVTLNNHSHTTQRITGYQPDTGVSFGGVGLTDTTIEYLQNYRIDAPSTSSSQTGSALVGNDGDSNNGHKHTLTDPEHQHTGTTDPSLVGITTTNTTGTVGGAQHENIPPYLVLNYIILAKYPSF